MNPLRPLFASLGLLAISPLCLAAPSNGCAWRNNVPGPVSYTIDMGSVWVPRDAPLMTPIGKVDIFRSTPSAEGKVLVCDHDGTPGVRLSARIMANAPAYDDQILQTSVPGVGIKITLEHPFDGRASNSFVPIGPPVVPFDSHIENHTGSANLEMARLLSRITLVKIGDIAPGPQIFDSRTIFSAMVSDVGLAFNASLAGTILQAQCTISSRLVSADPVQLGDDWNVADFTGPGFFTPAVPFQIHLNSCSDDPNASVARAHIRLEGTLGSQPIEPLRGIFSLTGDSSAEGVGIQVLMDDGTTPVALDSDVPIRSIPAAGSTVLPFTARYYQTGERVTQGQAKGALNFTITYQ